MSNKLICPICGAPTYLVYGKNPRRDRLCGKHANELFAGKIVQCDDCGQWHSIYEPCKCKTTIKYMELPIAGFDNCVSCGAKTKGYAFCKSCWNYYSEEEMLDILNNIGVKFYDRNANEDDFEDVIDTQKEKADTTFDSITETNSVVVIDLNSKSKCITCGKQIDGLLFCTSCYHKYKSKELLFKITNCTNVELLDESYESKITCKDGHIVKSKAEFMIDDYLYGNNIIHAYEKGLPYGATEKEVLHPDFYLPNYLGKDKHVYIEYWGFNENNIQYTNTKKFKLDIYRKKGITLISVNEKDTYDIETSLDRKLNKEYIKEGSINE